MDNYEFVCCKQNSKQTDPELMIDETVNKCGNFIKWILEHVDDPELPYLYNLIGDKAKNISIYDKAELHKTGSETLYYKFMTSIMRKIELKAKNICVYIHDNNNETSYLYHFKRSKDGNIKATRKDIY